MKKNENKQSKNEITALKDVLRSDGRKLTWLSAVTDIHYQRLQRIVNQGYDPSITEAVKIAGALKKPITLLFPIDGLHDALFHNEQEVVQPAALRGKGPGKLFMKSTLNCSFLSGNCNSSSRVKEVPLRQVGANEE